MSLDSVLKSYSLDTTIYPLTSIWYPICGIILYIFIDIIFQPNESAKVTKKKTGNIFKAFVVLHNIGLALFSMATFYNIAPLVFNALKNGIFSDEYKQAMCDDFSDKLLGMNNKYGFWCWAFYVSKYYEFIDTWILLYKGRKPIFLQVCTVYYYSLICIVLRDFGI